MKINGVIVLNEVADDLNDGKKFYDRGEVGVGDYFWDSLVADIESLIIFAGIHSKKHGLYRMLAKRFPYSVYYVIEDNIVHVVAVLPMRRDPDWIKKNLVGRN